MSDAKGTVYSIRVPERVTREAEEALLQLAQWGATEDDPMPEDSVRLALEWRDAYVEARATLAQFPQRCPRIPESGFREEIRHLLFRRVPNAPVWRLLFTVEEDGEDGPVVRLLHLRAGIRRPIRRSEARAISGDL